MTVETLYRVKHEGITAEDGAGTFVQIRLESIDQALAFAAGTEWPHWPTNEPYPGVFFNSAVPRDIEWHGKDIVGIVYRNPREGDISVDIGGVFRDGDGFYFKAWA